MFQDANANPRPQKEPFGIPLNQRSENRQQPPNFKYPLRDQQLDAVHWAFQQEAGEGKTWTATAVSEANLNAVGYRLEARAVAHTKISGGVLAFDVAFGKTPVVLALTQMQKAKDLKWAKVKQSAPKSIRSKATLVVVPDHLPGQVCYLSFLELSFPLAERIFRFRRLYANFFLVGLGGLKIYQVKAEGSCD